MSMGLQVALGLIKGNSTDEGIDARTSYQFVFALFAAFSHFSHKLAKKSPPGPLVSVHSSSFLVVP